MDSVFTDGGYCMQKRNEIEDYEIRDYEIKMLLDRRKYYRRGNKSTNVGLAYYYTRSIIRYMARLIFAIGWNKLRNSATPAVNKKIYTTLFRDPKEKRGKDSIEPGTFAYLLKQSADKMGMYSVVKKEYDLLQELGEVRNYNAHVINAVDFSQFYADSDIAFSNFADYFEGKFCSYIMPCEYVERNEILCEKLSVGDSYPEQIRLSSGCFEWTKLGNRLFYAVTDENTRETNYYCLSPFIEVPLFIEDERPHFRIYNRVKDNGYGDECDSLFYDAVVPKNIREINGEYGKELSADFEETSADYSRADLFSSEDINEDSSWVASLKNDVFINISSYPGFADIIQSKYKYCVEICPIRKDVINFCKDNKKQVVQINGNGGVGKTALVLSVLSELFMCKNKYFYTNLMFFSAKKSYYLYEAMNYRLQHFEKEADIHDYNEFIIKLADLLGVSSSVDIAVTADALIKQINDGVSNYEMGKKFLLVIDDLDSLNACDQRLIIEFIYKLDSRVFKTIVTTRNIVENSPVNYQINELTDSESILFAKWYAENNLDISSWSCWSRMKVATEWIRKCGEGNPLTIQMLLVLVKAGLEKTYNAPATKRERITYLYSTVRNLLKAEEKQIFEICRQLYLAIPDDKDGQDMLLAVPEYLAAAYGIDKVLFEKAIDKLVQLKLIIRSNNQLQFRPYSKFILSKDIVALEINTMSSMFKLVWKNVRENPDNWLTIRDIEGQIASFIMSIEREKGFDIVMARCILERILENPCIYDILKKKIYTWLDRHSICVIDREDKKQDETTNRLIQSIEKDWEILKKTIESGYDDPSAEQVLRNDILMLRKILASAPNASISKRLSDVRSELKKYDL